MWGSLSFKNKAYALQDAGYGEKYFFTPENDDDSDDQVTIEDEVNKLCTWTVAVVVK